LTKLAPSNTGVPVNIGLPPILPPSNPPTCTWIGPLNVALASDDVPETDSPPEPACKPSADTLPDGMLSDVPSRVSLPDTVRLVDMDAEPLTVRPLIVEALSVDGIWFAIREQNEGVVDEPEQFPNTVLGAAALRPTVSIPLPVTGELVTVKMDGILRPTEDTVPVPLTNIRKLSLYVNPAPIGVLSWIRKTPVGKNIE
jgi:hypothetical protein